jgi:hypothetical protein
LALNNEELASLAQATRAVVLERESAMRERIAALENKSLGPTPRGASGGIADDMVAAVDDLLRRTIKPLVERIAELERAPFSYEGPHDADKEYKRGQFVSHGGSLWHCESSGVGHKPGDGPGWRLAVKAGRDAR